jgi:hypothetical protein
MRLRCEGISPHIGVIAGLDPRIHLQAKEHLFESMDCRVKPGNDRITD